MTKKREDLLKNQVQELAYELEKVRDDAHSASFVSASSFQQNMVTELEMKVQSLQMQNETLREGNQETINAKYIELENKVLDLQKDNNKLTQTLELERNQKKKIVEDFDTMTAVLEEGNAESKEKMQQSQQHTIVQMKKLENKVKDMEVFKKECNELKTNRDKQQTEIKSLFEEK